MFKVYTLLSTSFFLKTPGQTCAQCVFSCPLPSLNCWIFAWTTILFTIFLSPFLQGFPPRLKCGWSGWINRSVDFNRTRLKCGWKFWAAFQPIQPHFNRARKFLTRWSGVDIWLWKVGFTPLSVRHGLRDGDLSSSGAVDSLQAGLPSTAKLERYYLS